ncbi:hypothetical protein [Halocella sp. SP3-1]|uniref:hypothetical protein n=1 Tax=Halocella sp. SP3-1 TaxID=2382161 RepID=UPI0013DE84A6|nr:hypothetical protein [Halocella sp. SP3-1]
MNRYKSRKFIVAIVVIILSSFFLYFGKLNANQWIAAVNISLYTGGNVVHEDY